MGDFSTCRSQEHVRFPGCRRERRNIPGHLAVSLKLTFSQMALDYLFNLFSVNSIPQPRESRNRPMSQ